MTLEPKDSLPGAEPRRLSDDQPAEHFSMRQRVATGKSVPFDQSPLPTPAPNPFIGHDPRGRAIAAQHPPALPVDSTADPADSLTFGLLQFALQQLDRDPDELSESERLLLKSAEVLVEQLHNSLGQLTKQRTTASKSTRRRSTSTKSKKKKTTSTKKTSRKRNTKR